jgi:hypothetical protein
MEKIRITKKQTRTDKRTRGERAVLDQWFKFSPDWTMERLIAETEAERSQDTPIRRILPKSCPDAFRKAVFAAPITGRSKLSITYAGQYFANARPWEDEDRVFGEARSSFEKRNHR